MTPPWFVVHDPVPHCGLDLIQVGPWEVVAEFGEIVIDRSHRFGAARFLKISADAVPPYFLRTRPDLTAMPAPSTSSHERSSHDASP